MLEGNLGNRPLPEPVRLGDAELLKPSLPEHAARLWDEVVTQLAAAGIARRPDTPALTALCLQWDVGERARKVIESEGLFALGSMGQLVEHPAVRTMTNAHLAFLKFCQEYGLTAAGRARIAALANSGSGAEDDEDFDLEGAVDADFEVLE